LTFRLNQSKTLLNTIPQLIGKINDVQAVFRTNDSGGTWTRINDDQHQFGWISHVTGDLRIYGGFILRPAVAARFMAIQSKPRTDGKNSSLVAPFFFASLIWRKCVKK